jgi:hypothetical protein
MTSERRWLYGHEAAKALGISMAELGRLVCETPGLQLGEKTGLLKISSERLTELMAAPD